MKYIVERARSHMTVWLMRRACWIRESTNTRSDCIIHIAFPLQQWSHERGSVLLYTTSSVTWYLCQVLQLKKMTI